MEVKISDLTYESSIYPRGGKNEKTVEAYAAALTIGAHFPPIKIQTVFNYPDGDETTEAIIILDGIHRWSAFKESGFKKIAAVQWRDKPLDYEKNKVALLLESAQCNISHGDRLSPSDKKRISRDIASTDPECIWTESALAERLGLSAKQSMPGSPISVPGRKQAETPVSSGWAALDGLRKRSLKQ